MKELKTYNIFYDEEGDFLEVVFNEQPEKSYVDEIETGIFIKKDEDTNKIIGISILSFKKRSQILKQILEKIGMRLPLDIVV